MFGGWVVGCRLLIRRELAAGEEAENKFGRTVTTVKVAGSNFARRRRNERRTEAAKANKRRFLRNERVFIDRAKLLKILEFVKRAGE